MDRRAWLCPVCGAQSQAERNSLLFERSGLIANERDWHLDYIADMAEKETALASALGMLAGVPTPSGWLLFYGSYGVGKSGILKSLTAAMCRAGVGGRYVNAMDIVLEIQAGFNLRDRDETARAIIDRYAKSPFLAVDEIDRVNTSQWTMSILFKLFDERYNLRHLLATALATNRTPESLRDDAWSYFESRTRDGTRVRVGGAQLRGHEIQ
jgi:DNA replication protein DnaC